MVGQADCGPNYDHHAAVWRDGTLTRLGFGTAYDINDGDLIVGELWDGERFRPTLWVDEVPTRLDTYLPGACPAKVANTWKPCFEVTQLIDVNNSGQIVARGTFRDRGSVPGQWISRPRSFLLSPSTHDADLAVTQEAPLAEVAPGSTVTRTVTVRNEGPDTATGVVVDLTLPPQLSAASCTTTVGECAPSSAGRRVEVDALAPGASARVTVTARVAETATVGSTLETTATVLSRAVRDRTPGNDVARRSVRVSPMVDDGIMWATAVPVGTESHPITRHLTNRTEEPLTVGSITATDGFAQTNDCPAVLPSGGSCAITVVFRPTEVREYTGTVTISGGPFTISVSGRGKVDNVAPVIVPQEEQVGVVGEPFELRVAFTDADVADTHTAQVVWPNSGMPVAVDAIEETDGSGVIVARRTFTAPVTGSAIVLLSDSGDNTVARPVPFRIAAELPNTAPVVTLGGDATAYAGEELTRLGSFTDTGSTSWTATVDYGDGAGQQPLALTGQDFELRHAWPAAGTYEVTVRVRDAQGLVGTASFRVEVTRRNTAPEITLDTAAPATEGTHWTLTGDFTDPDADSWTASVDHGDGTVEALELDGTAFTLDHVWADDGPRTVTVTVRDDAGGETSAAVEVPVANAAPTATILGPEPGAVLAVGAPAPLAGSFTDPGSADTHTATWLVTPADADGRPTGEPVELPATVVESGGLGTVSASRAFTEPGRYLVRLVVTDDDGGRGETTEVDGEPALVVVVDPARSVEVKGAVAAPSGSCLLTATCGSAGNTAVTLMASYAAGSLRPTGELSLTTSGFKLRSSELEVLFGRGDRAVVEGTGVVNGDTAVRFTATALAAGRLRVQVWRVSDGKLVYDNAPGGLGDGAGKVSGQLRLG